MENLLTVMLFLPAVGALIQMGTRNMLVCRWLALGTSVLSGCTGIFLATWTRLSGSTSALSFQHPWMQSYSMSYALGLDGLNALVVLLIAIVFPLLIVAEWNRTNARRGTFALLLLLQFSSLGTAMSQDLFLMFFFWSLSSLPGYFLIGILGDQEREKNAVRYLNVSSIASALFLISALIVYYAVEPHTFLIKTLSGGKFIAKTFGMFGETWSVGPIALSLFAFAIALRTPIWPFHGWFMRISKAIPSTILVALLVSSAPISVSMFIRISYELFPDLISTISDALVWIGVINLILSAFFILSEKDLRGFLSLLSLSSVGMALVGAGAVNSFGIVGSLFQVFSFGLSVAGIGIVTQYLYEHKKSYEYSEYVGLVKDAPHTGVVMAIFFGCIIGIPSGVGFIGTSLLFIGAFSVHPILVAIEALLLILLSGYLFQVYRKMFLASTKGDASMFELDTRSRLALFPLAAVILLVGFYPAPLIDIVRHTTGVLLGLVQQ